MGGDTQTLPTSIEIAHVAQGQAVYGGRGTGYASIANTSFPERGWLGNPYRLSDGYSRERAVRRYAQVFLGKIQTDDAFYAAVERLRGKRVACFCRRSDEDEPLCHLDVVDTYLTGGVDAVVDRFSPSR